MKYKFRHNQTWFSPLHAKAVFPLMMVGIFVIFSLQLSQMYYFTRDFETGSESRREDNKLVPNKGEVEARKLLASQPESTNNPLWQLHSAASRLSSNRAGHLSAQLGELIGIAKQHLVLAKNMKDMEGASEIEKEILSGLELFQEMEIEELEESLELTIERVEEKVARLNGFLSKLEVKISLGQHSLARLRSRLRLAENEIKSIDLQSKLYSQIASKTVTPGLHCVSMRLTVEYLENPHSFNCSQLLVPPAKRFNKGLFHYALFSDNILAIAVVVNSTAQSLKQPWKHVFHLVTDRTACAAVKAWFCSHPPKFLAVDISCLDDYPWITPEHVPVMGQIEKESLQSFYFRKLSAERDFSDGEDASSFKYRNPKYLSVLNHLRFYLPEVFPELDRVMFLDDDIVVQKDLSPLWKVDTGGRVNLAVETCGVTFHRLWTYLNFSHPLVAGRFDPQGCAWAFGMNLFNLSAWREGNFTEKYNFWQRQNEDRQVWKLGTLPAGLLTFYNSTQPLDRKWHVLGLGRLNNLSQSALEEAGVLHFNGHAKPWLELAITKYRTYWRQYLDMSDEILQLCEVS